MVFIDLLKTYGKVLREIFKWLLMKKELPKIYVNLKNIYTYGGTSEEFVQIGFQFQRIYNKV